MYGWWISGGSRGRGIRPIIGCECMAAAARPISSADRRGISAAGPGSNRAPYLIKLYRWALWSFYYKPRIELKPHAARPGTYLPVGLSGGRYRALLSEGRYDSARELALRLSAMFGPEHFYLEMQDHGIPEQRQMNAELKRLSDETVYRSS